MTHYHKEGKNINLCAPRTYYVPFLSGQEKSYNREDISYRVYKFFYGLM